jgi:hypothetical protein
MKEITRGPQNAEESELGFAPTGIFVETVFYKHAKNAHWFVLLFLGSLFLLFIGFTLMDDYIFPVVVLCLLILVPLFAVFGNRTWFSFSAIDERKLFFDMQGIQVGKEYFHFTEIAKLDLFFHSFCDMKLLFKDRNAASGIRFVIEDGNRNELDFQYGSQKYSFRFILRNLEAYHALRTIVQFWITVNDAFAATEKYPINSIQLWNIR